VLVDDRMPPRAWEAAHDQRSSTQESSRDQARALLEAVRAQQPSGPRLVAFFAMMFYAGLRPEEAVNLSRDNDLAASGLERGEPAVAGAG